MFNKVVHDVLMGDLVESGTSEFFGMNTVSLTVYTSKSLSVNLKILKDASGL